MTEQQPPEMTTERAMHVVGCGLFLFGLVVVILVIAFVSAL